MRCLKLILFVSFLHLVNYNANAARILGVSPMPARSHQNILQSLFKELADRGHDVTVISPFPQKEKRANYTDIALTLTAEEIFGKMNVFELGEMPIVITVPFMWYLIGKVMEAALKPDNVQEFLNDKSQHFDLVIAEYFFSEALLGFAHRFNAPIIGVTTSDNLEVQGDALGDPYPYAYVPTLFLDYSDHMTFCQRLHNTVLNIYSQIGHRYYHLPKQEAIMRKYFKHSNNLPSLSTLVTNTSLLLTNSHIAYNYPRPHVPNIIQVGGQHITPPKKATKGSSKIFG